MIGASARAALRLARRNAGRSRWRSLLVGLLVLLPVAAMVGAITLVETTTPSPERAVTNRIGAADLIAYPQSSALTEAALLAALPPGSRAEPISSEEGRIVLPGRLAPVSLRSIDIEGLGRGALTVVGGRAPERAAEVAVSRAVARLAGVGVGGSIRLDASGDRRVVGFVEDPLNLSAPIVLQPVSMAAALPADRVAWLVGLPPGASAGSAFSSAAGDLPFIVNTRSSLEQTASDPSASLIVLGGLALVEAALVAAAAFAVGVRRRQRELGLLAACGAEPRHLATTVLAEGVLLGGLGAGGGVAVGLVAALAASPWLDQLTNHRNPAVGIDPRWPLAAAAIGVLAALLAAAAPAWTAARVPVLAALSGRRPPAAPARRSLVVGLLTIGLAVATTSAGAEQLRAGSSLALPLLLGGAVLGTLGFGACSPWLLERFGRPAARLPLSLRIAFRDAARARSRSGPIVTALLASFAATVALAALLASQDAAAAAQWQPWLLPDQIYLQGQGTEEAGAQAAKELGAVAAAPIPYLGSSDGSVSVSAGSGTGRQEWAAVAAGSPQLMAALGVGEAMADIDRGSVVVLSRTKLDLVAVRVNVVRADGAEGASAQAPARVVVLPAGGMGLPDAILPPQLVTRLGLSTQPAGRYLLRLGHPVTGDDLARAASIASVYPDAWADAALPPGSSQNGFHLAALLASLLFGLAVTAIAVALGEAESRPDQRVLLALGAEPGLRRRIAAARAGVLTILGGILAVPAGLLPVWGLLASRGQPLVVPVPEVAGALVLLPLLAVAITFLASRPIPDWSAFRGPAS